MKILTRYILKESAVFFGISLFAFTSVLLTVKMLQFMSLIVNKGVALSQIAEVFISIIPTFLEIAIPMASLLGLMLAFARLSGDSELVVMRSSGVSLSQLLWPVVVFGLFALTVNFVVSIYLRPWGYDNLNKTLFEIARSRSTAGLDPGVFSKLGNLTIYTEDIDHHNGLLHRLLIDDQRDSNNRKIIVSRSGKILSNDKARTIIFHLFDGEIHEIVEGKYALTHFDTNSLVLGANQLLSDDKQQKGRKSQEMSFDEIRTESKNIRKKLEAIDAQDPTQQQIQEALGDDYKTKADVLRKLSKLALEAGRRFSIPLASFVLVLIAMPLGVHPPRAQRTWGIGLSSILGLGVFVIYYGLLSVGMALADSNAIHPLAALWLPNAIVLLLAIFFNRQIGSERWQSIAEGLEGLARFKPISLRKARA